MNDARSRALLTTALHPSSSPNERLMALAALTRALDRAGLHASEVAIMPAASARPADDGATTREAMRRETEIAALSRRVKAQEKALREAEREAARLRERLAALDATLARRDDAMSDDACQIAALEADLAARDRAIASLRAVCG